MTQITKLAMIRDQNVPTGQPAPLHVKCPCTSPETIIPINADLNRCPRCKTAYDRRGWVPGGIVYSGSPNRKSYGAYEEHEQDESVNT